MESTTSISDVASKFGVAEDSSESTTGRGKVPVVDASSEPTTCLVSSLDELALMEDSCGSTISMPAVISELVGVEDP